MAKSPNCGYSDYIYLDSQVNKAIGENALAIYLDKVLKQCENKQITLGNISNLDEFKQNLQENCMPEEIINMDINDYDDFLLKRRKLMAKLIEKYYKNL